jgi:hypothetical protein
VSSDLEHLTPLLEGMIYGASIAPDGRRIAVVSGRAGFTQPGPQPLRFPDQFRLGNRNYLGRWQVDVIDRSTAHTAAKTVTLGEGTVTRESLPRWSADARRLGVVIGNEAQDHAHNGAVLIDFTRGSHLSANTASLIDAEALAAVFAGTGVEHLDARLWQAPPLPRLLGDEYPQACIFSLGHRRVALSDIRGLKIVSQRGLERLVAVDSSVLNVTYRRGRPRIYAATAEGVASYDDTGSAVEGPSIVNTPVSAKFVGATDTADLLFTADSPEGLFLWRTSRTGERRVLARANEHMASILTPQSIASAGV